MGAPDFVQKRVDLLLGLDIALLSAKQQITHMALLLRVMVRLSCQL